jgi:predicted nucleic acid-binding protein
VRFWDSSALIPLIVLQTASTAMRAEYLRDPEIVTWWSTEVECVSAITRLEREGRLTSPGLAVAISRLAAIEANWQEIRPTERLRTTAKRLLRTNALRAADALQLAAAIVAAVGEPRLLPILTLDERLARAAEREGFPVIEPA